MTQSGILGTPSFMPPEQARGDPVDARVDVYSLGATLYALVTGLPPFQGKAAEVIKRVLDDEPIAPWRLRPGLPRDVEVMIQKAMSKEKARRYASAAELADDLERYLKGEPITARPPSFTYRMRRRVARNPWAWAGMALAALALVGWPAGAAAWGWLRDWLRDEKAYRVHCDRARQAEEASAWNMALNEWKGALHLKPGRVDVRRGIVRTGLEVGEARVASGEFESAGMAYSTLMAHQDLLDELTKERVRRLRCSVLDIGTLSVTTDPPGAEVWREGQFVHVTPGDISGLRAGFVEVEIRLDDYAPVRLPVEIPRGQQVEVRVELIPVERVPEGMTVVAGGPFRSGRDGERVDVPTFLIDRTEVTVGAFLEFVRATGREFRVARDDEADWEALRDFPDLPMVLVTWDDAQAYAEWRGARLPTRLEWEKAARGIDGREKPWGDGAGEANWDRGEDSGVAPVGESQDESPYGCRDLAGNVAEWTADEGFVPGERLLMGGHWQDPPATVTLWRSRSLPVRGRTFLNLIGFRCARTP